MNNDDALLADLLSTKVKGVPGDLLLPLTPGPPEEQAPLDTRCLLLSQEV